MTVDFGAATGGTFVNDGIFAFDSDDDDIADATGYCVTYEFEEQGCVPVPYSGLVTLLCPDGTPGVLNVGSPVTLTSADVIGDVFGIVGGGAFYPQLTAALTPATCPTLPDNSDGSAAFVLVNSPDNSLCSTPIPGATPLCDGTGGNAAVPLQFNPIADPLLSALFGAGTYSCTLDETVDLSYACGTCGMCEITPAAATNIVCDDNGTPGDPSDDTYTFDILVNGSNPAVGATQTFDDDQGNTGTAYGSTVSYGPYPISGGDITVTFTDADDAACTAMMMATAPAPCSNAMCAISVDISNFACDDGGTPEDPSDDTVTFDYTVTDIGGIGATWSSDQGDAGVAYGTVVSVGPVPADGTTWTITVNDDADMLCTDSKGQVLTDCAISPTDIPTLSEWGLITLALLLMTFGSVKMAVGSVALANTSSRNIPVPGGSNLRLPFDAAIFRKSFMITGLLALVGFAICFAMYATVFMSDIIGVAVAGPVFAYLGHLLYLLETRKEK